MPGIPLQQEQEALAFLQKTPSADGGSFYDHVTDVVMKVTDALYKRSQTCPHGCGAVQKPACLLVADSERATIDPVNLLQTSLMVKKTGNKSSSNATQGLSLQVSTPALCLVSAPDIRNFIVLVSHRLLLICRTRQLLARSMRKTVVICLSAILFAPLRPVALMICAIHTPFRMPEFQSIQKLGSLKTLKPPMRYTTHTLVVRLLYAIARCVNVPDSKVTPYKCKTPTCCATLLFLHGLYVHCLEHPCQISTAASCLSVFSAC